jgi:hypothetical protein
MSSSASPSGTGDQSCNENSSSSKFDMWNMGHSGNSPEPDESPVPASVMDSWIRQQQDERRHMDEDRAAAEDGIHFSDEETLQSSRDPESPPQSLTYPSAQDSASSNSQHVEGGPANVSPVSPSEIVPPALASTSTQRIEDASTHTPPISPLEIAPPALASTSTHQVEGATTHISVLQTQPLASTPTHQIEGATTRISASEIPPLALTSTHQVEGATTHISASQIHPLASTSTHQVEGATAHISASKIPPLGSTSTSAQPVEGGSAHQAAQASPSEATGQRQTRPPSARICGGL